MNLKTLEYKVGNAGLSGVAFSLSLFFFQVGVKSAKQALK